MLFTLIPEKILQLIYTLLLCAGAVIIGWSVLVMQSVEPPEDFYYSTSGIVATARPTGAGQYEVRVEYTIPGVNSFTGTGVVTSSAALTPGDKLLVHYNQYAPAEFVLQTPPLIRAEYLIFFGIVIGGLGFRFFIRSIFHNAKQQFIQEHGRKVAPLTTELENATVKLLWLMKIPVVRIHCTWKKSTDSEELNFYSDPYPVSKGKQLQLDNVKVYFIPQDPNRYFVDL
ncbi:MAG: hypothetical protein ACOC2R_00975 [Spirochaetota bacterium]